MEEALELVRVKGEFGNVMFSGSSASIYQYLQGSGPAFFMARPAAFNLSHSDFQFAIAMSYREIQRLISAAGIPFCTPLLPFPACLAALAAAAAALSPSCASIAARQASPVASIVFPPGLTFSLAVCLFFSFI